MKKEKTSGETKLLMVIAIAALLVFQLAASKTGSIISGIFDHSSIDPDNTFAGISIHHVIQMLIGLAAIILLNKKLHLPFYLKWTYSKTGMKYTAVFTGVILVYVLVSYRIGYGIGSISPYGYPLNAVNISGTLGFQLFLSGPSEEILFRALPITVMLYFVNRPKNRIPVIPVAVSSVLFSLAHINWQAFPLTLQINWFQLLYAFLLGTAYAVTYIKTKSILYPMVMHSISNVLMVGFGYLFMAFYP